MRALSVALSTLILTLLISTTPAAADGLSNIENRAMDLSGYMPSLYTGKWHSPQHEPFRRCIMDRESNFNYLAANRTSSARGAYQFLDRS